MRGALRPGHVDRARLAGEGAARVRVTDGDAPSDSDRTLSPAASIELNYEECVDARSVPPFPHPPNSLDQWTQSTALKFASHRGIHFKRCDPYKTLSD